MASCVRGYRVYCESWLAVLGGELYCEREIGNIMDRYAVVKKPGTNETVGDLPRKYHEGAVYFSKVVET